MGRRLQTDRRIGTEGRVVARLTAAYLAVFVVVIAALSVLAFAFVAGSYRDALAPALDTPEGQRGLARALHAVVAGILLVDAALVIVVGAGSYALARAAVHPLMAAREREERFAADAAHELRTPLAAIASVAQAARTQQAPEQDMALQTITERALEAGTLVGDLLTLARNEVAEALIREPIDVAAIVSQVVRDTREAAEARGVALQFDGRSALVEGDQRRIVQLVRNLLENALRHASTRITVRVEPEGHDVRISVWDDGSGVPSGLRSRLFERFAKGPESTGSGLGLAICRWVARSHGGEIALEGTSCFVTRLPLGDYPTPEREPS
ncbi:MAG: HAMP domain-containing histidine kinase [Candidatus Eremiobacteraeota bacterium]|nr:HAMP domain-containing histidine kinase [Candidatus Eremiobacteraeota bacterium]MBC5801454.1 HAMP domain-containing histidine kinase [Candidatus Eremiobacteraeota bacterium]MBC5822073.1 HAMP domain-containing histidine kinase [Candidatus Eremiobacteraeota bacterium]